MPNTKAENLITAGAIIAVLSAIAVLIAIAAVLTGPNPTLAAQLLVPLGAMGFLAGLALFIVGMDQRK